MLEFNFVQNLPIVYSVVVAGAVPFSVFILETYETLRSTCTGGVEPRGT
jgi:hypothetical protein